MIARWTDLEAAEVRFSGPIGRIQLAPQLRSGRRYKTYLRAINACKTKVRVSLFRPKFQRGPCIRARLQSCRKVANDEGFSPCSSFSSQSGFEAHSAVQTG